ncbi:MAG: hypothetical protein Q8N43_03430 [Candidatus Azambacteria bacterium]|nr:hypothetical protein [Candidatus Azambacteria bacterium]
MKLIISETQVQDATIPIRWCLDRNELEKLKEREVKNPSLLLVVTTPSGNEWAEMDRYLIPLDQMLAYVQFHKPGKNRILAAVVWRQDGDVSKLKELIFERKSSLQYEKKVLTYNKKSFQRDNYQWEFIGGETELEVVVPEELFAKEPPAYERWWVNLWFETKPRDQCQYRRRRMIAYTIQVPIVFLFVIFISICRILAAGTLLFLGKRKVDLKPIIHPFLYDSMGVWERTEASVFLLDAKGKRRHWLVAFFSPLVFLAFVVILIYISLIFPSFFSLLQWWHYLIISLAAMVGIAVVVNALFAVIFILHFLFRLTFPVKKSRAEERAKKRTEKRYAEFAEERRLREVKKSRLRAELEQLLACNGEFVPKLSALPRKKRTVYLRFQNLKVRVCKPFAL